MEATALTLACPDCGEPTTSTLACLACGRILSERAGADHFARLGLPASIDVDERLLETHYLKLSRALHPDFHGGADEALRALANRNSALLNEAHRVLTDEQLRAEYLIGCLDAGALERGKTLPPEFLMEAMELSEAVQEARAADAATLAALAGRVRERIAERRAALADPAAWATPDTARLARLIHEQRVLRRVLRDAEGDS